MSITSEICPKQDPEQNEQVQCPTSASSDLDSLTQSGVYYNVEEVLDLCVLSSWEEFGEDNIAAWYDEEASWAKAGTAPPASPAQADEKTITGGAPIRKCNHIGPVMHLRTVGITKLNA